jgi:tetratricopeptide (TPR) repeat protein
MYGNGRKFMESITGFDAGRNQDVAPQLGEEFNFSLATALAMSGRYQEAERLLVGLDQSKEYQTAVLDLRAKIFAQQRRYAEAEVCWLKALSLDPGNQQYRKAVDTLVKDRQGGSLFSLITKTILLSALAAGIVIIILIGFKWNNDKYSALQQKNLDSNKVLKEQADILQQVTIFNKELTFSIENLSYKIDLLEQQIAEYQKIVAAQTNEDSNLLQQVRDSQKSLALDISNFSEKPKPLKSGNFVRQNTNAKRVKSNKGWVSGIAKILFTPAKVILNLGKKDKTKTTPQ